MLLSNYISLLIYDAVEWSDYSGRAEVFCGYSKDIDLSGKRFYKFELIK